MYKSEKKGERDEFSDSDYDEEEEGFIGTDWALGDDALRQMIETLEDSIDSDLDE